MVVFTAYSLFGKLPWDFGNPGCEKAYKIWLAETGLSVGQVYLYLGERKYKAIK